MEPQQSQMTHEEAKASLGIATHLQDMLMPQAPMEGTGTDAPGVPQEENPQPNAQEEMKAQIEGTETRLMEEIKTLREEMKTQGDGKQELADLKKQIESILNEN